MKNHYFVDHYFNYMSADSITKIKAFLDKAKLPSEFITTQHLRTYEFLQELNNVGLDFTDRQLDSLKVP